MIKNRLDNQYEAKHFIILAAAHEFMGHPQWIFHRRAGMDLFDYLLGRWRQFTYRCNGLLEEPGMVEEIITWWNARVSTYHFIVFNLPFDHYNSRRCQVWI